MDGKKKWKTYLIFCSLLYSANNTVEMRLALDEFQQTETQTDKIKLIFKSLKQVILIGVGYFCKCQTC